MKFNLVSILLASSFVISCGSNKSNEESNVLQHINRSVLCIDYTDSYRFSFRYIGQKKEITNFVVKDSSSDKTLKTLGTLYLEKKEEENLYGWTDNELNASVTINAFNTGYLIEYKGESTRGGCL